MPECSVVLFLGESAKWYIKFLVAIKLRLACNSLCKGRTWTGGDPADSDS